MYLHITTHLYIYTLHTTHQDDQLTTGRVEWKFPPAACVGFPARIACDVISVSDVSVSELCSVLAVDFVCLVFLVDIQDGGGEELPAVAALRGVRMR